MKKIVRRLLSVVAAALLTLTTVIGSPLSATADQGYSQQKSQTSQQKQKDYSQTQSSSDYGNAKQQSKQTNSQDKQYTQKDQSSQPSQDG